MPDRTHRWSTAPKRTTATKPTGRAVRGRAAREPEKAIHPRQTAESAPIMRRKPAKHPSEYVPQKSITFTLDAPAGRDVSISGTFNNWEPQAMAKGPDGLWRITLPLMPGTYEYQFLVDTEWRPDPNNPGKRSNKYGNFNSFCEVR